VLLILLEDELRKFEAGHCYSSLDELEKKTRKKGGSQVE
jgi:hypothetical protein